jgi:NAD(P)-dependent dehydrogenase (short-subunit alcohol dehydrogenase family)
MGARQMDHAGVWAERMIAITGGASGIGLATASLLAEAGARIALLDRDAGRLEEARLTLVGDGHVAIACDVANAGSVQKAFTQMGQTFGSLDVLVNNAGINPPAPSTLRMAESLYDQIMNVNMKGVFLCSQQAIPLLALGKNPAIVNVASVSGLIGWGGTSVYSASKGAVIAFTKFLAVELAADGIRVNAVCPGSIRTPMVEEVLNALPDAETAWQTTANLHPLGRVGEAVEVARAIRYLGSPEASFVTGTHLVIDGGLTAK